ncbi:replication-relaxation family protein [Scopulibacillus darangshiensis]|uniref:replication-relaxation family protein n=1 Tax=Scopulibacillus darangshiensis TaxID=442528 RepID=UPI0014045587|nr:replication-relaxation family protein [Scopulibacillus darangshiensis]
MSLSSLGFASRSQLQKVHSLGSDRNACRVMSELKQYVNKFVDGESIFYLNKKGAQVIGHPGAAMSKKMNYTHTLMRNDLYIYYGQPDLWKNEPRFKVVEQGLIVQPDAFFKHDRTGQRMFVEIDHTQYMVANVKKLERYKQLSDSRAVHKQFGYFPEIVWLTISNVRRERLEAAANKLKLKIKVFLRDDII